MRRQAAAAEAARKDAAAAAADAALKRRRSQAEVGPASVTKLASREPDGAEVAAAMERVLQKASAPLSLAHVALSVKDLFPGVLWNLAKWVAAVRRAQALQPTWFADCGEEMLSLGSKTAPSASASGVGLPVRGAKSEASGHEGGDATLIPRELEEELFGLED